MTDSDPHAAAADDSRNERTNVPQVPLTHPGDAFSLRRRVLYVVLLGALTALGPFTIDLYLPAFPALQEEFATTQALIQLTLTGTMLGFGIGQLIVGPLSDKIGRRPPLLVVTAVHVIASVWAALSTDLLSLGLARVLMGVGAAASGVVAMAMVRDLFGGKRLVVMLSRLALVTGTAPVLAPLIGSWLLGFVGWQGIFYMLAGYALLMLASALFVLPETLPPERRQGAGESTVLQRYRSVLTDRVFLGVLVIGGMMFSGMFSYLSASSFLFQSTYGFTAMEFGLTFGVNGLGIVIGSQTAARVATRFGPQWVLAYSTAALVLSAIAIVVADAMNLGVWGTMVPLFFFMLSCGFTFPCVQVLALDRHAKAAGTAASILGASNNAVAAIVSPVVGLVSGGVGITATSMASVMVGCGIIAILGLWLIVRPRTVGELAG